MLHTHSHFIGRRNSPKVAITIKTYVKVSPPFHCCGMTSSLKNFFIKFSSKIDYQVAIPFTLTEMHKRLAGKFVFVNYRFHNGTIFE